MNEKLIKTGKRVKSMNVESEEIKKQYTGIVISFFRVKNKEYNIGNKFTTYNVNTYNTLINSKRIK
jgi:hypothetical protein